MEKEEEPKRYFVEVVLFDTALAKKAKDPELDRWIVLDTDDLDEAQRLFRSITAVVRAP